jgi:hypothetical protein
MLVRRRYHNFTEKIFFVYDQPHHQSLLGVPVPILDVDTPGSYRLRTQYTKNVQSLYVKEVGIRQSQVIP